MFNQIIKQLSLIHVIHMTIIMVCWIIMLIPIESIDKQEGLISCQSLTSTVRLKVLGCRVKNGGCRIKSEELRVMCFWILSI